VVEIDAQIFDWGEEVDRAKSVATAQFKIGRRKETESAPAATQFIILASPISFHYQNKGGFLSLVFNLLDDF
jgi:hypothetical protein